MQYSIDGVAHSTLHILVAIVAYGEVSTGPGQWDFVSHIDTGEMDLMSRRISKVQQMNNEDWIYFVKTDENYSSTELASSRTSMTAARTATRNCAKAVEKLTKETY